MELGAVYLFAVREAVSCRRETRSVYRRKERPVGAARRGLVCLPPQGAAGWCRETRAGLYTCSTPPVAMIMGQRLPAGRLVVWWRWSTIGYSVPGIREFESRHGC